jgi:ribonuclease HI
MTDDVFIFTDGASRGNPGPGGFGAVVCVANKVFEIGGFEKHTTNNRMELSAVIEALNRVEETESKVNIFTDSRYLINGITKWIYGWQKNDWQTKDKKEVLNKDLWQSLLAVVSGKNIEWKYVGGHIGIAGNERADEIATAFADGKPAKLFNGKMSDYGIDISNIDIDDSKKTEKNRKKASAYSYVSKVDGKIMVHQTWKECEARVKGKRGVLFKKSLSKEDETEIIKSWS